MVWDPSALGGSLLTTLDPNTARPAGVWRQDAGHTLACYANGTALVSAADPWGGATWAALNGGAFISFIGGFWFVDFTNGQLGLGGSYTFDATHAITVVARWKIPSTTGFHYLYSGGSNAMGVGWDNTGKLFNFTSTGFNSANLIDTNYHVVAAVTGGSAPRTRLDGVQVASGTNASATVSGLQLCNSGSGVAFPGQISRAVFIIGDPGDAVIAQAEAWVAQTDTTLADVQPYLMFGFNHVAPNTLAPGTGGTAETFCLWDSPDLVNWRLLTQEYQPPGATVRDTMAWPDAVGGNYYAGYTSKGFNNGQEFGILQAATWPVFWTPWKTVDCSSVVGPSPSPRCWFSNLYYESGTFYALFCASATGGSNTNFLLYWAKTTDYWATYTIEQITGTAITSNAIDHHLTKVGPGNYCLVYKDVPTAGLCRAFNTSLSATGWNTGGTYSGVSAGTGIEGGGVIPIPGGVTGQDYYVFCNRYNVPQAVRLTSNDGLNTLGSEININSNPTNVPIANATPVLSGVSPPPTGGLLMRRRRSMR
jgi:hypothetical protein